MCAAPIQGKGPLRFVPAGLFSQMLMRHVFLVIPLPNAQVELGA
jgi:hypothetical protein